MFFKIFYGLIPVKDVQQNENEWHISPRSLSEVKGVMREILSSSIIASNISEFSLKNSCLEG